MKTYFYKVVLGDLGFHGDEGLTYQHDQKLDIGQVVRAPLRNKTVTGFIVSIEPRPSFKTKPLSAVLEGFQLPVASARLLAWLQAYYPAALGTTVQLFTAPLSGVVSEKLLSEVQQKITASEAAKASTLPPLGADQTAALQHIAATPAPATLVLHGETGSGKTRVYLEVAAQALAEGRSSIILTPEISLTPQLVQTFTRQFGAQVLLTHSRMTERERRAVWLEVLASNAANQPRIMVGPRSALFAPLQNVGAIIIDEAHESAYKQEQAPRYLATRVAAALAGIHQARLILGTATPPVVDYYMAEQKKLPIIRMQERHGDTSKQQAAITVIDLKDKDEFQVHRYLSKTLLNEVKQTIERGEQVLLFLNRRGTARLVMCEQCAWQALCPACDLPLTYHGDQHLMLCHTCGFRQNTPTSCPECGFASIVFKSFGTKALAAYFEKHYPHKQVARFDLDNKKAERIEQHYDRLYRGEIDIIIGTQMLAKGLDLPKLGLVGVVLADTSLYIPDYTADERTWQLLYQVIGRVGRGHRAGRVVIQTFHPDNPSVRAAITKDWEGFYQSQLAERKLFRFPPFSYVLKLSCSRKSSAAAQASARKLKAKLGALGLQIQIDGPSPAFHEKQQGLYQWQLIIKAKKRADLVALVRHLPANWIYDLDPGNLL